MSRHVTRFRLTELPDFGMPVEGSLRAKVFDLPPEDTIQPTSDLDFDLNVTTDDDKEVLFLQGKMSGNFELQCVTCLEKFAHRLTLDSYFSDIDLEPGTNDVDIAEYLREDALMAIPTYPHCDEDGTDPDCVCPRSGDSFHYEKPADPAAEKKAEEEKKDVWGALDDLQTEE